MITKMLFLLFCFSIVTQTTYGYIEAGTGSLLTQIFIAGTTVGLYTLFHFRGKIKAFFKKK